MKSKRRHELQHNVLDAELATIIGFFRKRGRYFLVGALAVAVVGFVVYRVVTSRRDARQQGEATFYRGMTSPADSKDRIDALKELAEQGGDEGIKALATVAVGDGYSNLLAADRPQLDAAEREDLAARARQWYRKAIDRFGDHPLAVAKARYGLAKLAEERGEFDEAESQYGKIRQMEATLRGQPIVMFAQQGLLRLNSIRGPVRMATTAPAPPEPTSLPTSLPTSPPTSLPASRPAPAPSSLPAAG